MYTHCNLDTHTHTPHTYRHIHNTYPSGIDYLCFSSDLHFARTLGQITMYAKPQFNNLKIEILLAQNSMKDDKSKVFGIL
jgi:hypothetical protein